MTTANEKRDQVCKQLRVVAALCKALGDVSRDLSAFYAERHADQLLDQVGLCTASQMEILGDMLNGMNATDKDDAWMDDVFVTAHAMFPDAVQRMGWFGAVDAGS